MKEIGGESGRLAKFKNDYIGCTTNLRDVFYEYVLCSLGIAVQSSTSSRQYRSKAMIPPGGLSQRCSVAKRGRSWPLRVPVGSTSQGTRGKGKKQLRHWARMVSSYGMGLDLDCGSFARGVNYTLLVRDIVVWFGIWFRDKLEVLRRKMRKRQVRRVRYECSYLV